ncbi:MAG: translation initiation factor IF-6 [Candidatus Micrarchaeia archaeon]
MAEFKIEKAAVEKNPFLGLFMRANDEVLLVPPKVPRNVLKLAEEALKVPSQKLLIDQSYLIGTFCAVNSTGCVLPSFADKKEIHTIKKLGFNVFLMEELPACGNNILTNDKAAVINPRISKHDATQISDCLGVEVFSQKPLSNVYSPGSANVVTNKGLLAYNETPIAELKMLEKTFTVKGSVGSSNLGVPFNGISVVANKNGALVGQETSGFEVQRVYEALNG